MELKISIPSDNDGFILLQCPKCSELFKITAKDCESDDVLDIYCPFCGMVSDSYLTDDVIKLANIKIENEIMKSLHNEMKKLEGKMKSGLVQFKAGKKPKEIYENKIESKIDELIITKPNCCKREIKLNFLTKSCGYHCPFCGVNVDGS